MPNKVILFKAKSANSNDWIQGYLHKKRGLLSFYIDQIEVNEILGSRVIQCKSYEVSAETICQYIGRTDNNDDEIFENDILNIDGKKAIVIWLNTELRYMCKLENDEFCSIPEFVDLLGNKFD